MSSSGEQDNNRNDDSPKRKARSPAPKKRSRSRSRTNSRSPKRRRSSSPSRGEPAIMELESGEAAYLLGRGGATKRRLATFSQTKIEIDPKGKMSEVQIYGSAEGKELAKMCIEITLQQRDHGQMKLDFSALEKRDDVTIFDVDSEAVGFVLGTRGATLRELESRFRAFMFFNNDKLHSGKKRLYIMGDRQARELALRECENAVEYKLSGRGDRASWRDHRARPNRRRSPRRRSRSPRGRRSPSPRRSRSPPRHRRSGSPPRPSRSPRRSRSPAGRRR